MSMITRLQDYKITSVIQQEIDVEHYARRGIEGTKLLARIVEEASGQPQPIYVIYLLRGHVDNTEIESCKDLIELFASPCLWDLLAHRDSHRALTLRDII